MEEVPPAAGVEGQEGSQKGKATWEPELGARGWLDHGGRVVTGQSWAEGPLYLEGSGERGVMQPPARTVVRPVGPKVYAACPAEKGGRSEPGVHADPRGGPVGIPDGHGGSCAQGRGRGLPPQDCGPR